MPTLREIEVGSVSIRNAPREVIREEFQAAIRGKASPLMVMTPNPEIALDAVHDPAFRAALAAADMRICDGVGLLYASVALSNEHLVHRYTGVQAYEDILDILKDTKDAVFVIFGGGFRSGVTPEEYVRYAATLRRQLPNVRVEFVDPGSISAEQPQLPELARETLRSLCPTVIAVILGHKKQAPILQELRASLPSLRFAIGLGGTIDMMVNPERRAPEALRKRGLEWMYRLWRQPMRYRRILNATLVYPFYIASLCMRQGRFIEGTKAVFKMLKEGYTPTTL